MDIDKLAGLVPVVDENAVEAELEAWLDGTEDQHPQRSEPFAITSVELADWALRKLATIRAGIQEYDAIVARWQEAGKRLRDADKWFCDRLEQFALENRTKDQKSWRLAHGTVRTTAHGARIVVTDDEAAVAWAEEHQPDAVRVTKKVLVSELKDHVKPTEVVVAYTATEKATGEVQTVEVAPVIAAAAAKLLEGIAENLGDGYVVEPITELRARTTTGAEVPGIDVQYPYVTASATPLHLPA